MEFGLVLPTMAAGASREGIDAAAETASRLGWGSVWVSDHVLVPHAAAAEFGTVFEALTTLAFIGARYADLRLGTSVLVAPQRDAIMLAKELATLDALTGGRLIVAVGVGNDPDEYLNLGHAERFVVRGAYLDETIRLWRHLWSGSEAPFHGEFHELMDFTFGPLPANKEHIPVLIGGKSERAFERAGLLGDGYHSGQIGPSEFGRRALLVQAVASKAGRPRPQLSARVGVRFGPSPASGRYRLAGDPAQMLGDVHAFAAAGCQQLVVAFGENEPDRVVAAVERFHEEVVEPSKQRTTAALSAEPVVFGESR
ncbi:MAG: TIGR03619 family F420-dependent LLM class oxidoreductase [Candidatus Limnocylindrales bacterium]|jgi:probable F420-dependent oxidoreductase